MHQAQELEAATEMIKMVGFVLEMSSFRGQRTTTYMGSYLEQLDFPKLVTSMEAVLESIYHPRLQQKSHIEYIQVCPWSSGFPCLFFRGNLQFTKDVLSFSSDKIKDLSTEAESESESEGRGVELWENTLRLVPKCD